jgi:uncharacterized membrane protein
LEGGKGFFQPIIDIATYNQPIIGTGKECQSIINPIGIAIIAPPIIYCIALVLVLATKQGKVRLRSAYTQSLPSKFD